jgi:hypothetical protein
MRFEIRDSTSRVIWEDGEVYGRGPAFQAVLNAFLMGATFEWTETGPEITADSMDPLNAYFTIRYYGFLEADDAEEIGVPRGVLETFRQMTEARIGEVQ